MKKIIFATKGWKTLQRDYMSQDLYTKHLQKLHTYLQQDVSNYSFEEMIIHYGFISHATMQASISNYMQTGAVENAECYFYLAARAKATSDNLWIANPHSQKHLSQGQEVQLDCIMAAVLSGCTSAAVDMLEKTKKTFEHEQQRPNRSRKDCQQDEKRKKRILLEVDFYKNLLNGNDGQAYQLLSALDSFHYDPMVLQVMHTFFERDAEQFGNALVQHLKEFRNTPYTGELDYFVLLMEALYQKRANYNPFDFADAPALLLKLPECEPTQIEKSLGICCPSFDINELLKSIDKNKVGPKFMQY